MEVSWCQLLALSLKQLGANSDGFAMFFSLILFILDFGFGYFGQGLLVPHILLWGFNLYSPCRPPSLHLPTQHVLVVAVVILETLPWFGTQIRFSF